MAEKLIKRWKLAVLRVSLDLAGPQPMVASRLDSYASGSDVTYWQRTDPVQAFGLSISSEIPTRVEVPPALVHAVQETMSKDLRGESALWLRLEEPYGYLAAALWEDLAIDVPVLRVPDRLPMAVQLGRTWRVAMVVNAPNGLKWGANHVRTFTNALRHAFYDRRVEVDVFADAHTHKLLSLESDSSDGIIRLHNPAAAREAHERRSSESLLSQGRITSGLQAFRSNDDPRLIWADWITSGLSSVAVSALHVASTGSVEADRSVLALSPNPARAATPSNRMSVDSDDLRTLANVLGAALVSIAAPEISAPDIGARLVADRLGQQRPGPTIYSSLKRDKGSRAIAEVHAFIADPHGRPIPTSSSWFGYIQPESVQDVLMDPLLPHHTGQETTSTGGDDTEAELQRAADSDRILAEKFNNADEVPAWVAISSRFLESKHADLITRLTTPGEGKSSKKAYDLAVSEALVDIEAMVQRHTEES